MTLTLKHKSEKKYTGGFVDISSTIADASKLAGEKLVNKIATKIISKDVMKEATSPSNNLVNYIKQLKKQKKLQ